MHKHLIALLVLAPTAAPLPTGYGSETTTAAQQAGSEEPDFEAYFPDDEEGGLALDQLFAERKRPALTDAEYIRIIRQGLRRTTVRKLFILREFGNRYVWGKRPQHPDAIELMFHAADPRQAADSYGTRHSAVYFGLSVVADKTPRILDALVAIAMAEDSHDTLGRVVWGTSDRKEDMLSRLQRYEDSPSEQVRKKAADLRGIIQGEESASQWWRRHARAKANSEYATEIPALRANLRSGDSTERRRALDRIRETSLMLIMPKEALADFEAATADPNPGVRRDVVRIAGGEWHWSAKEQDQAIIALMLRMSRDPDDQVRYDAVYYGLSTTRETRADVVKRMLEMLQHDSISDMQGRIIWGLRSHKALAKSLLMNTLESESQDREAKIKASEAYSLVFGEAPLVAIEGILSPMDLIGSWSIQLRGPSGRQTEGKVQIDRTDDSFRLSLPSYFELDPMPLLTSSWGGLVQAGSKLDDKGMVLTLTLRPGKLDGILMHADEGLLIPFTGSKDEPSPTPGER